MNRIVDARWSGVFTVVYRIRCVLFPDVECSKLPGFVAITDVSLWSTLPHNCLSSPVVYGRAGRSEGKKYRHTVVSLCIRLFSHCAYYARLSCLSMRRITVFSSGDEQISM